MRCKALKPTSDSRLQDFLGTLQSFEAYLRFQPALIFPLAASRQLRRALTIRYRDSSVDSNIPGTSLDQGGSSHFNYNMYLQALPGADTPSTQRQSMRRSGRERLAVVAPTDHMPAERSI